jgi:hypothetical protein
MTLLGPVPLFAYSNEGTHQISSGLHPQCSQSSEIQCRRATKAQPPDPLDWDRERPHNTIVCLPSSLGSPPTICEDLGHAGTRASVSLCFYRANLPVPFYASLPLCFFLSCVSSIIPRWMTRLSLPSHAARSPRGAALKDLRDIIRIVKLTLDYDSAFYTNDLIH